ncbi:hypothetical protein BpHYR1_023818 [Brachionus plicatilis]|uniref:Uncharacterized protein n=1 Tax=Brachionus plicatilis TaxID=10195 RepID=A0A3M7PMJ6_BRAPC|nr:hypothetical protein BpHYR1_023818 [Brachionus plicatilis]
MRKNKSETTQEFKFENEEIEESFDVNTMPKRDFLDLEQFYFLNHVLTKRSVLSLLKNADDIISHC